MNHQCWIGNGKSARVEESLGAECFCRELLCGIFGGIEGSHNRCLSWEGWALAMLSPFPWLIVSGVLEVICTYCVGFDCPVTPFPSAA